MGIAARPFAIGEWVWVTAAAVLVTVTRLVPAGDVLRAVAGGTDVYLFLAGMMLLAEIARREGVFAWIACVAARASAGSAARLFALVYGVGIVVTVLLSNDATAVVLTPAVAAGVRAAKADALPYLFACAFVANAASFVLPISNPANLVVFSATMPPLATWLATFALPSACAIGITYGVLRVLFRRELSGPVDDAVALPSLGRGGRLALGGIGLATVALVVASALGARLGVVTIVCAATLLGVVVAVDRATAAPILRNVSWSTIALVAGLFVLVAAAERTGLLSLTSAMANAATRAPAPIALAAVGFATAFGSNLVNNLPAGLIAGTTVAAINATPDVRGAAAIGIDLGPNLSVTGSLATILWLLALRREGITIDAFRFFRVGCVAMPPALLAALESLLVRR